MFPPAMSSHFLSQHAQIFLAKSARRQPTGMTEKRANHRRHWDTYLYLCNKRAETKRETHTDVNYALSNTYLNGQPCSSTSHHQCRLQCYSSTLHLRLKANLFVGRFPAFLSPSSSSQWIEIRARVSTEAAARAQVQVLGREEKGTETAFSAGAGH